MKAIANRNAPGAILLEALEPRLLLAGTVLTALDAAGNLTITGDADHNRIQVTKTGLKQVTVTGIGGTAVGGLGGTVNNVTGSIKVLMKEGDDYVVFGTSDGSSTFWVGDETPPPGPYGTALNPKDLTVDLGGGDDEMTLLALTARHVSIVGGAGTNSIGILANGGSDPIGDTSHILGNLTLTVGDGGSASLVGTGVSKNCSIKIGNLSGAALFDGDIVSGAPCWVGGNLTILGGAGPDVVALSGGGAGSTFRVDGSATIKLAAAPTGNSLILLGSISIGGSLTFTGGADEDTVAVSADMDVAGSVIFNLLNGKNCVDLPGPTSSLRVGRDLTVRGGIVLCSFRVGRNVTVGLGAGDDNWLDLNAPSGGFDVGRNLAVTGGSLKDTVSVLSGDSLNVVGSASFSLGDGQNEVLLGTLTDGLYVGGNLTCSGAADSDYFVAGGAHVVGNATFSLGGGHNMLDLGSSLVSGNLSYTGAAGREDIALIDVQVLGNTVLRVGDAPGWPPNAASLMACQFAGAFSYTGGKGGNDLYLRECSVNGATTVTTGSGVDVVAISDGSAFRRLTINTGGENDIVRLGQDPGGGGGYDLCLFKENVTVNTGAGADQLHLGGASPDPHCAVFLGEQVKFDGGADGDVLTFEAEWLFCFTPLVPNWETILS
jgi:hypothetical protein